MSVRTSLQRFSSRRRNVASLLAAATLICGVVAWRSREEAPASRHINAGIELMQSKNPAAAEREWREAVRLDPNNVQAWQLLGDYYQAAELWPQAREAFEHVLSVAPDAPGARASLANCALKLNDIGSAQSQAELAVQQNAADVGALKVLAAVAWEKEQDDKQLQLLRRVAELSPQDVKAQEALAEALSESHEYAQARPLLARILQLNAGDALAYRLRATARLDEDATPEGLAAARADLQKALQLDPDDVESHRYLGRVYMRLNQPTLAIEEFKAVGRDRPYASAHFVELAAAYRKAGDVRAADAWAQRFATVEHFNMRIRDLRDRIARKTAKFDNYLELGRILLKGAQDKGDSFYLFQFRYKKGQVEAADLYLSKALELRPQDAKAQAAVRQLEIVYTRYLQAGLQALQRRDREAAAKDFARLILLRPQDERTLNATRLLAR